MRDEVHILVYCPIDTLQWGSTHSAVYADTIIYNGQHTRPEEVFHVATDIADTGAHSEILQVVVQCLRVTIQQWLVWSEDQNKWPWSPQSRSRHLPRPFLTFGLLAIVLD